MLRASSLVGRGGGVDKGLSGLEKVWLIGLEEV